MRSEKEIRVKFNDVYWKELCNRKKEYLKQKHLNCRFNVRQKVKEFGVVGFCSNKDVISKVKRSIYVCNDEKCASNCECFECLNTEESIRRDFEEIVSDPARCGREYPKLATLIWLFYGEKERRPIRFERMKNEILELVKSLYRLIFFKWW